MRTHNRGNHPIAYLKWSTATNISRNLQHVLDPTDYFVNTANGHSTIIEEMRRVRNHITHGTASTRELFKLVITYHYGAYARSITPGVLLWSTSRWTPPLIQQYIQKSRLFV